MCFPPKRCLGAQLQHKINKMSLTWEDREVRIDIPFTEMRLKTGEKVIDRLENIEDTKGNGGDRGRLIVTNIRMLWHSVTSPRINLSIGFNCITSISTKIVNSKLRGTAQALHLLTTSSQTKFEFIFTSLVPGHMRHFTSVMGVQKAYISSKLYRELKLRGAVIHNKQLKILPLEQVVSTQHGVWNLSSDQGSLGCFIVTNVRFVWFADMNEAFNISLPYLQISTVCEYTGRKEITGGNFMIKVRTSKFGTALVVTTSEISGSFVLGFRIDPEEKLQLLFKELTSLHSVYKNNPIFGVEFKWSKKFEDTVNKPIVDDIVEVEELRGELSNTLSTYLADQGHAKDRPPIFSNDLGLAIESVKEGYTLQKLWEVLPS